MVSKIRENRNIHQHLDLIAGLPYEDYGSFQKSFDAVYAMKPDQLQLGFLKVLRGAPISLQTEEFGIAYTSQPPYEVLYTKWLSYGDVIRLKKVEEMVEQYYNSCQFVHTLSLLEKAFESPFAMFESLAGFYEEKGYFTNSPARSYRYDVLLEFADKYDSGNREIYVELLTFDLYLRENMKSRPAFCKPLTDAAYRDFRHAFYREEEKSRKYLSNLCRYDARQLSGMTHLEPFVYPVWDAHMLQQICKEDVKTKKEQVLKEHVTGGYILFDYSVRDSLSNEAAIQLLDKDVKYDG